MCNMSSKCLHAVSVQRLSLRVVSQLTLCDSDCSVSLLLHQRANGTSSTLGLVHTCLTGLSSPLNSPGHSLFQLQYGQRTIRAPLPFEAPALQRWILRGGAGDLQNGDCTIER